MPRMPGLISEDRHPPPSVFSPCIKAGFHAGLFLLPNYWHFGLTPRLNKGRIAILEVSTG